MKKILLICSYIFLFPIYADDLDVHNLDYIIPKSHNSFGGIGSIITPSGRFSDDGELTFGLSKELPFNRIYAKMQIFPWMEGVLKYTETTHISYNDDGVQTWKDKGIDVKFRLLEEGKPIFGLLSESYTPELALGINDIGGTGSYDSQYIVGSKRINQNLDFSFGMGFGRLGGAEHISNPFEGIMDSFSTEDVNGGTLNPGRWFNSEKAAFFSSLEYLTPIDNLSLKIEYDSSDYSSILNKRLFYDKRPDQIISIDSRINFGFNYRLNSGTRDKVDLSFGVIHGNSIYANFAVHSNLNEPIKRKYVAPAEIINIPDIKPYLDQDLDYQVYLKDIIMWQMASVGFATQSIIFNGSELQIEMSQGRFFNPTQAIDLAGRILAKNAPSNIDRITIINIDQGIETLRASISLDDFVKSVSRGPLDENLLEINNHDIKLSDEAIILENDFLYPTYSWSVRPHMLGTIQHQQKFYFWQLEALVHTQVSFMRGLYLTTDYGINIDNNYEGYTYHIPDGELYHVRMDRRLYLKEGESGLRKMQFDYLTDITPNTKAKLTWGILEWMYGGAGGEVLYMPDDHHWGLGFEAYWVKQRDFDQKFSFKDYETVTGFINYYQDLPFLDMRFKMSAGKFLGKDKGVHLEFSRRFESGARVGAIVALTDCDAICTGEGSFNKWIYFDLPMDLFYVNRSTRSRTGYAWSPLTKDQGTKVEPGGLYGLMVNASDEMDSMRMKKLPPNPYSFKKFLSGFGTQRKTL